MLFAAVKYYKPCAVIELRKGKATRKHSLHGKTTALGF